MTIICRNDELSLTMSWEFFILFVESNQNLLKISVIPILLTFIYLLAHNMLVNNQLNSSMRHIIVTKSCSKILWVVTFPGESLFWQHNTICIEKNTSIFFEYVDFWIQKSTYSKKIFVFFSIQIVLCRQKRLFYLLFENNNILRAQFLTT